MKKLSILIFISQFVILFSQKTYFDENDKIISEKEYTARVISYPKLKVCNDTLQKCKIIPARLEEGTIESSKIINDLEMLLKIKLDTNKPTIITFHPGKDRCNSSGKQLHKALTFGIKKKKIYQIV